MSQVMVLPSSTEFDPIETLTLLASTSIAGIIQQMYETHSTAVQVMDAVTQQPLGLFTDRHLIEIIATHQPLDLPLATVLSRLSQPLLDPTLSDSQTLLTHCATLHRKIQRLNWECDRRIQARTDELRRAYQFEAMLTSIREKVRDSLDETHILQSAVEALAKTLGIGCCNATLFDWEVNTSTIFFEYATSVPPSQGHVYPMGQFPELYEQLLNRQTFQFCSRTPNPTRGRVAMLTCPIFDDQGVLGSLWLINHSYYNYSASVIRLVQQVASQCAIALRQARLYQASQTQVKELQHLNQLKDDFLSTISHELRTPMASIQLATEMLEASLQQLPISAAEWITCHTYTQILHEQSDREMKMITALLELTHFNAQTSPVSLQVIDLATWLHPIVAPFQDRMRCQQQTLILDLQTPLPTVTSDPDYLDRIITELLNNACKYTPSGKIIRVHVEVEAQTLFLHITNTGVEIAPEEHDRIFDKFYRIPNADPWKYGGTGLGLALVKKQVEKLHGTIGVHSQDGWTRFTVTLPAIDLAISPTSCNQR